MDKMLGSRSARCASKSQHAAICVDAAIKQERVIADKLRMRVWQEPAAILHPFSRQVAAATASCGKRTSLLDDYQATKLKRYIRHSLFSQRFSYIIIPFSLDYGF